MSEFIISCCSTADLTKEHLEKRNIHYVCFHYNLDGTVYDDDLGQTMSSDEFYKKLIDGAECSTSQVNISEYLDFFTPFLEAGKDILHISISSGLSGSVNSARNAAAIAQERFPERKIYVIDSLAASSGYGLLMDYVADLRDKGKSIEELRDWVEENKSNVHHWFFSTDLTFYVKGGRVSKVSGWFGGLLNICPLLNVDHMGRLIPRLKARGKKNALNEAVKKMEMYADNCLDYNGKCYISHSHCYEDARLLADTVEQKFENLKGKIEIYDIGTTIGCHSGPGTVALFFMGAKREN